MSERLLAKVVVYFPGGGGASRNYEPSRDAYNKHIPEGEEIAKEVFPTSLSSDEVKLFDDEIVRVRREHGFNTVTVGLWQVPGVTPGTLRAIGETLLSKQQ